MNTNKIMELFKKINPLFDVNDEKQIKEVNFLLDNIDFNKLYKITEYAVKVQGGKFAPVITNPYQLKTKLGQLIVYAKKQQNNQPTII